MLLIKVEAINIWKFVDDSNDLSTSRGASLMLLRMPAVFEAWLAAKFGRNEVKRITRGASKAVFQLTTDQDPESLKQEARNWLSSQYVQATIGLAIRRPENKWKFFDEDEHLTTAVRLEQVQGFSIAPLDPVQAPQVCEFDKVRPALEQVGAKDRLRWVSQSVKARRSLGLLEKQKILHSEAGLPSVDEEGERWRYTPDLEALSTDTTKGNLNSKIALFYFDGNSFGKGLREKLARLTGNQQVDSIGKFDAFLQGKRSEFLRRLIEIPGSDRWLTRNGERRIEILLWGGDEGLLIVPSWCGWETAELFCQVMYGAGRAPVLDAPLKHGMSLIFAHHNAPIHALRRLAHDLVEREAKANRSINQLSYLTLESFDHVGEDLERFRRLRVPLTGAQLTLDAEASNLVEIKKAIRLLQEKDFPRRKIYQAVLAIARKDHDILTNEVLPFVDKAGCAREFNNWCKLAGGPHAGWCHLAELWDYLAA